MYFGFFYTCFVYKLYIIYLLNKNINEGQNEKINRNR